ncbi:hypothetical protein niasHS_016206 [Heterodera schachtii]|uniref:Effector protein n=1 Tax=Heterodera schachtii TaxID=97005 RepID=A0ABD2HX08_HETSC
MISLFNGCIGGDNDDVYNKLTDFNPISLSAESSTDAKGINDINWHPDNELVYDYDPLQIDQNAKENTMEYMKQVKANVEHELKKKGMKKKDKQIANELKAQRKQVEGMKKQLAKLTAEKKMMRFLD